MRVGPSGLPPRGIVVGLALGQSRAGAGDEGEIFAVLRAIGPAKEDPLVVGSVRERIACSSASRSAASSWRLTQLKSLAVPPLAR